MVCTFFSCNEKNVKPTTHSDSLMIAIENSDTLLELTQEQADSLEFRFMHHYTDNFNFIVNIDSLILIPREEDVMRDTCIVRHDDIIAVADIKAGDTVWIKVARDQYTMGWITEDNLLKGAIPNDTVSQIINALSGSRLLWMSAVVVLGLIGFLFRRRLKRKLQIFRFDEMDSFYPTLLLMLVSIMACIYASIQNFAPEFWQEYYFHPTLNPVILPFVMAALVAFVWLVIIVFVALIIEVYHHFYIVQGISYLLEMLGASMLSYLIISWTTLVYIGYVILPAYIVALLCIYFKYVRCRYVCGSCGQKMHSKGICQKCGKLNK